MAHSDDQGDSPVPILTTAIDGENTEVPVLTSALRAEPVPVLADPAGPAAARFNEEQWLALRSRLTVLTRDLAERLIEETLVELEMVLVEKVSARLRDQLPDMLERALRDHLDPSD
jgi:hypothetical protein